MRLPKDTHEKILSAYQLLQGDVISISSFEHLRTILKGIHPDIDEKLEICSNALDKLQKLQSGDIISLSAETLPEDTEEKKNRKKALLLFISSIKNLKNEIKRIDSEFTQAKNHGNSTQDQLTSWGRIIKFAKGPFGIVTLIALVIVGIIYLQKPKGAQNFVPLQSKTPIISPTISAKNSPKMQIITYNGKQIPLNQLHIGQPHSPGCDSPHYHANNGYATAIDGTAIIDPGNCGFGKVKDVQVIEVAITPT